MSTDPKNPVFQVTVWDDPNSTVEMVIDNLIMKVPYRSYLQSEIDRWESWGRFRSPREAWVQVNAKGQMALFSWERYMKPVGELGGEE